MGKRKNLLFITGTRADFGKLKPLMKGVEEDPDFKCSIFATGMHMLEKYGNSYREIEKENFSNLFPFYNQSAESGKQMDMVLAETIRGISNYVRENQTDMIVVHGDRVEALAGAIVGALQGIRIAHIEGGERSGTVDELIRHAVSKLAHLHFVATNENKKRLVQLGENVNNIFVIGSPEIDIMLNGDLPSLEDVLHRYDISFKEYAILIYHPVVTELDELDEYAEEVIEAMKESGKNFVVIYPNNDSGSDIIFRKLKTLNDNQKFRFFPSIRFEYFLALLRNAQFIAGNSSCGIQEAPVYGVPTVNIGTRQKDRFRTPSIYNVPEKRKEIVSAIRNLPEKCAPVFTYGTGNSKVHFLEIIRNQTIWNVALQKKFFDII